MIQSRKSTDETLIQPLTSLNKVLNGNFALINALVAFVEAHPDVSVLQEHFKLFAAGLVTAKPDLRAIQVFHRDSPVLVYPIKGNEAVLGRRLEDLLDDERPDVYRDVQRTLATREITISQPYELRQGGLGIVARKAIFNKDRFLGIVTVILDIRSIVTAAGLHTPISGINLALRTGKGDIFWGNPRVFQDNPLTYQVNLLEGEWILAAAPVGGWEKAALPFFPVVKGFGLLLVLFFTAMVFMLVKRNINLKYTVNQQSQDLAEEQQKRERVRQENEARARTIADFLPIGIIMYSPDGQAIYSNRAIHEILQISGDKSLDGNFFELIHPDDQGRVLQCWREFISGHGPTCDYEATWLLPDQTRRLLHVQAVAISENNRPVGYLAAVVDITERKAMEEKLKEREELLQETGRIAKVGGWEFDPFTLKGAWTDEVARIHDLDPDQETSLELGLSFYSGEQRKVLEQAIQEAIELSRPYELELELNTAKGMHKWVRTIGRPKTENGKLVKIVGSFQDITEIKQAEEEIRNLSERLKHYFATSPTITYALKVEGEDATPVWISDNITNNLGYEIDEALDRDWWFTHVHPDDLEQAEQHFAELFEKGSLIHEYRFLSKTGNVHWVQDELRLVYDGQGRPLEIVGSWTDISDRKKSENRIYHLNLVLRAIRDINQLIVQEMDPDRLIERACEILYQYRGYNRILIILADENGRPVSFSSAGFGHKSPVLPDTIPGSASWPACNDPQKSGVQIYHSEDHAPCNNKCPFFEGCQGLESMSIQLEHNSMVYGHMFVSVDSDFGIDLEEQSLFQEMAGDMAYGLFNIAQNREVRRVGREKDRIEAELRQAQKLEAIGRLAGGVAHDFNNMLSVISGYANLALLNMKPDDPLYTNLKEIENAAARSTDLTRQLLAFSRKQVIEPKVINVNELIENQKKMLERLIGEDIEVSFLPENDIGPILADHSQVHQILANLAVNARDAITGVGAVTIKTANITIKGTEPKHLFELTPGDYILLSFSDNGEGMDQKTAEHIFEPFFSTKAEGKGTGLGLSTVYGIVKQNNGFIHVISEPGQGATFKIYFPRHIGREPEKTEELPTGRVKGNETILIVEDEEMVLDITKLTLQRQGYEVMTAQTPGEAVAKAEKYGKPIHLLLTDVVMPGMNGKELKEKIENIMPDIKTIFMSGYTADIIAHRGIRTGEINFIHKPFNLHDLAVKIREVLDRKA